MKKTVIVSIIVATILIIVAIVLNLVVLQKESAWLHEHRTDKVFSDISELEKLDEYAIATAPDTEQFMSADIEAAYCKTVCYDGESYQVYAFVFSSKQVAKDFYEGYTGNSVMTDYGRCIKSAGIFSFNRYTRYIVFNDCNLYLVEGGNMRETVGFINWLNASFKQDIQELERADMAQ